MSQLTTEEIEEINTLRDKLAEVVSSSGQISLQIQLLNTDVAALNLRLSEEAQTFKQLLDQEKTLIKRLSDKYGTGQIDFDTGKFTPEK